MGEVHVRPVSYRVSLWPDDSRDSSLFDITVEYRGKDRWAVLHGGLCLGSDGKWDWEPRPSSREDDWLAAHRFSLDRALELARSNAPHVSINGHVAAGVRAKEAASGPGRGQGDAQ